MSLLTSDTASIEQAKKLLTSLGYKVTAPEENKRKKKTVTNASLVKYFYALLAQATSEKFMLTVPKDKSADYKALKAFQKNAAEQGLSELEANEAVYHLITLMFKHYEKISFTSIPSTLRCVLTSHKWALQQATTLEEEHKRKYYTSVEYEQKINSICSKPNLKFLSLRKSRQRELAEILNGEPDGKKKY